jgi:hypothetical protein
MRKLFTCSLLTTLSTLGCTLPIDGVDDDGAADPTGEQPTGDDDASATGDDDDGPSPDSGGDDSGDDSSDGGSADSTGGGTPSVCTDATLLAGNPYFNGDLGDWNPAGHPMLGDPPLRMRYLADAGGQLAVDTQQEVWLADGSEFRRIAGDEEELELQYQPSGACADVRFIIEQGIVGLPNGNLVVADVRGNGLVELSDPGGDCTAAPIAGNPDAILDVDVEDGAAAQGDVDGPGADARFFGVELPIADEAGNIYVNDSGNAKIKRVGADADRTVTTLFDYLAADEPFVLAMTALNGTVYATGQNATEDIVWAIDAESGEATELFRGRGLFEEIDSSQQTTMFALEHDGVDLLVASNKGYVFRLSTSGEPLGVVAGMGTIVDYPQDLDLSASFALDQLPLRTWGVGDGDLLMLGSDLVYTGNAAGIGFHLWSIHCGG